MEPDPIQAYLHKLERELRWRGLADRVILAELESHLLDALEQNLARGLNLEQARQMALQRFGSVRQVAAQFEKERKLRMQKIVLAIAVIAGLLVAYIDSRPTWDDTAITVFSLLLAGGILGLLARRRPWLVALALGIWLPLWEIPTTGNPAGLVGVVFAFAGVYAGWFASRLVRSAMHPA